MSAALLLSLSAAWPAELVMFRRAGCPYCAAWDRDIGPIYGKSNIAKRAPLRTVDLDRDKPAISLAQPVIYTPTFVLVNKGREVGRIEGYPGPDFFWGLLERLLQRLPSDAATGVSETRQANARALQ
jgi:thioredoxin-related protein